jgi:hypothetical protein
METSQGTQVEKVPDRQTEFHPYQLTLTDLESKETRMTFRGPLRKDRNIFCEVFGPTDHFFFDTAFSAHDKPVRGQARHLSDDLGRCRGWVKQVITIWAGRVVIPDSLAFQVITTGDYGAVQRHYNRRHSELLKQRQPLLQIKDDAEKHRALEAHEKLEKAAEIVIHMGLDDVRNWLRGIWVECLSLDKPVKRSYHSDFRTLPKMKPTEKVGEHTMPKPKTKRKDRPTVEHKSAIHDRALEKSRMAALGHAHVQTTQSK